jgi:hypothetical protein
MKYGKYWFHLQKKIIANYHVLGLFIPKNKFRAKKKSVCHAAFGFLDKILGAELAVLSARKLKFWLQISFEPTWCTSNSES